MSGAWATQLINHGEKHAYLQVLLTHVLLSELWSYQEAVVSMTSTLELQGQLPENM